MKVCCLSDLHGYLPIIPECDLLLLCGDYSPHPNTEREWLETNLAPWLKTSRAKKIAVAGNHDFIFQVEPESVPQLDWTYLQDSECIWNGIKFWGTPWQPEFHNWAFNADEDFLSSRWDMIPDDIDILLLHGPPHKCGDFSIHDKIHTGSPSLRKAIERIQPMLVVCGHIHSGHGIYKIGKSIVINAAALDEAYQPTYEIITLELDL